MLELKIYRGNTMRNAEKQKTLPKGIRQKKNGSYIIDITNEGIRRTKTVKTYEEALQVLLEMQQNPEENTKQLTLKEAVDYCFQVLWRKGNRNRYRENIIPKYLLLCVSAAVAICCDPVRKKGYKAENQSYCRD